MKNLTKLMMLLIAAATMFSACNRNKIPDNRNLVFQSAKSEFLGDPNRASVDFYDLYLYDSKLTSNPNGDGTFVYFQLNTSTTNQNEIVPGNYNVNNSNQVVTFTYEAGAWKSDSQGNYMTGSYIGTYVGSNTNKIPITNGKISVSQNGSHYTISGIVTADGSQYNISYNGQITFTDMVVPLPETLTHGEIWYHGDPYNLGMKIYSIRLGADDVKISNFSGSGDAMQIEIYTPLTATTIIPDGTYPILVDKAEVSTAIDGYYDENDKADYGTWYYTADSLSVNKGSVKIQYLNGSTYLLDFNFTDDYYGYNFSGKYEGQLAFVNKTNSPVAVRAAVRGAGGEVNVNAKLNTRATSRERVVNSRDARPVERRKEAATAPAVRANRK